MVFALVLPFRFAYTPATYRLACVENSGVAGALPLKGSRCCHRNALQNQTRNVCVTSKLINIATAR